LKLWVTFCATLYMVLLLVAFQLYHYAERVCDVLEQSRPQFDDLNIADAVKAFFPRVSLQYVTI